MLSNNAGTKRPLRNTVLNNNACKLPDAKLPSLRVLSEPEPKLSKPSNMQRFVPNVKLPLVLKPYGFPEKGKWCGDLWCWLRASCLVHMWTTRGKKNKSVTLVQSKPAPNKLNDMPRIAPNGKQPSVALQKKHVPTLCASSKPVPHLM